MSPAIIVVAFNRAHSLERLLKSLLSAHYDEKNVPLIISIDKSDDDAVFKIAENFQWNYGEKKIIHQPERLGLKEHILKCGDLVNEYENIIVLEDDLFVSPYFYNFANQSLTYFNDNEKIAGISLYNHRLNVNTRYPFIPLEDGNDIYFLQFASSWGQAWTKRQWTSFRAWYANDDLRFVEENGLPLFVNNWPKTSWLKSFNKYLVLKKKYFVYPRVSLATNFTDAGTHNKQKTNTLFQVPLLMQKKELQFTSIETSSSVYDSHFEILPNILKKLNPRLINYNFTTSLNLTKTPQQINTQYILTRAKRKVSIEKWGMDLKPPEMNVAFDVNGSELSIITKDEYSKTYKRSRAFGINFIYHYRMPKLIEIFFLLKEKIKNKLFSK